MAMAATDVDVKDLRWEEWRDDPAPLYRWLRDEQPVFYDVGNDDFVVSRYADVELVLKDPGLFSSTPLRMLERNRISPLRQEDPPRHGFLRKIVMPLFTPAEMRSLQGYFVELAVSLLDEAEETEVIEVSSQLAVPLPGRVTCDILGVPLEEHRRFLELTAERLEHLHVVDGQIRESSERRSLEEVQDDLWGIVGAVVEARRREPAHDAITLLVQAQDRHGRDQIDDRLIVDMLLHFLTGGFHTTQYLVELLTHQVLEQPGMWGRLRADRRLVPAAIEETLRFEPPVQTQRRRAVRQTEMHGVEIPANASVVVHLGAANRDDRAFEDPDVFSLERRNRRHLAFSAGIHYCPGAPVSRFEVRALFEEMLDRYESIERAGDSERWPQESRTADWMAGYRKVPVRIRRAAT